MMGSGATSTAGRQKKPWERGERSLIALRGVLTSCRRWYKDNRYAISSNVSRAALRIP
jgi:hypothetical protein